MQAAQHASRANMAAGAGRPRAIASTSQTSMPMSLARSLGAAPAIENRAAPVRGDAGASASPSARARRRLRAQRTRQLSVRTLRGAGGRSGSRRPPRSRPRSLTGSLGRSPSASRTIGEGSQALHGDLAAAQLRRAAPRSGPARAARRAERRGPLHFARRIARRAPPFAASWPSWRARVPARRRAARARSASGRRSVEQRRARRPRGHRAASPRGDPALEQRRAFGAGRAAREPRSLLATRQPLGRARTVGMAATRSRAATSSAGNSAPGRSAAARISCAVSSIVREPGPSSGSVSSSAATP